MPIVYEHRANPLATGFAAFMSGRQQGRRANAQMQQQYAEAQMAQQGRMAQTMASGMFSLANQYMTNQNRIEQMNLAHRQALEMLPLEAQQAYNVASIRETGLSIPQWESAYGEYVSQYPGGWAPQAYPEWKAGIIQQHEQQKRLGDLYTQGKTIGLTPTEQRANQQIDYDLSALQSSADVLFDNPADFRREYARISAGKAQPHVIDRVPTVREQFQAEATQVAPNAWIAPNRKYQAIEVTPTEQNFSIRTPSTSPAGQVPQFAPTQKFGGLPIVSGNIPSSQPAGQPVQPMTVSPAMGAQGQASGGQGRQAATGPSGLPAGIEIVDDYTYRDWRAGLTTHVNPKTGEHHSVAIPGFITPEKYLSQYNDVYKSMTMTRRNAEGFDETALPQSADVTAEVNRRLEAYQDFMGFGAPKPSQMTREQASDELKATIRSLVQQGIPMQQTSAEVQQRISELERVILQYGTGSGITAP